MINNVDEFMEELGIEKKDDKKIKDIDVILEKVKYRPKDDNMHNNKERILKDVGYRPEKKHNSKKQGLNDIKDNLKEIKRKKKKESPPIRNFVVNVVNVVSTEKYNKYNKYNNTTNTTFNYNDVFTKDSQTNKIKWSLFVLSSIKKDFEGLDYIEMARVAGVNNIKVISVITQRMKVSGDVKLYNKRYNKDTTKSKKGFILTENTKKEVSEIIESIYLERIEESKNTSKLNEIRDKIKDSIKNIEKELEDNKDIWEIINNSLIIDINKLLNINPTLTSEILDNPTRTLQKLENKLSDGILDIFKKKTIRIKNLPKTQNLQNRKINSSNLNKPYTFDIEVITSTEILPAIPLMKYECPSCGTIISLTQELRKERRQPSRCSCGRRGGFKELGIDVIDCRILLCSDNQESIDDTGQVRNKRYNVYGDIANIEEILIQPSSKLKIVGIPFLNIDKKGDDIDVLVNYIEVNNELLVLNFTEEEIELFKTFSKQNPIEIIKKEVYDLSTSGFDSVKKALIIQQVKGVKKHKNNGKYKRGEIHILLVGDPGTAKSVLTSTSEELSIRCAVADSNRGTSAGLTGTFEYNQQLGRRVRMPGLFDRAKGGLLIWEEFNEADENVQATLKTPLESSKYVISLGTGYVTSRCPFSFLSTMNPKRGDYLDLTKPILQQIPLNPALKTRFDLIFGEFIKPKGKERINAILEKQDLEDDINKERIAFFKKYLAYCGLQTTIIPPKIKLEINKFCLPLIDNTSATFRIKDTLNKLTESFAKIELRKESNVEDFRNAKKLFLDSLQSTSLDKTKFDYSRFVETSEEESEDMKNIENSYNLIKDKDEKCDSLELFKHANIEGVRFNHALSLIFKKNIIKPNLIKKQIKDGRL